MPLKIYIFVHIYDLCTTCVINRFLVTVINFSSFPHQVISLKNIKSNAKLPNAALLSCANISHLELVSCGLESFSWVTAIQHLSYLDLSNNFIATIPSDLDALASSLVELTLSKNPIEEFTITLTRLRLLRFLNMDGTLISTLPNEIGDLKALRTLSLQRTEICELPPSFSKLKVS